MEISLKKKTLKIELLCDLAIPLLSVYPKEVQSTYQRNICTSLFVVALCTIAEIQNQPKLSADEKMKKM
jgi:hypothetical protein